MTTDFAIMMLGICVVIAGLGRFLPRLGFSRSSRALTLLVASMLAFASLSLAFHTSLVLPNSSASTPFLSAVFDGWWLRDRLSILSLFGLAGGIVTIACAHSIEAGRCQLPKRSEVGSLILLWALASLVVMADHILLQWMFLSAACWLSVWQCTRMSGFSSNGTRKHVLILLGLADILAMIGLQGMSFIRGIGSISDLQAVTEIAPLDSFQRASLAVSAIWLGLSFLIRLGGVPFLLWNGMARGGVPSSLVVLVFPVLLTMSQIFRWQPVLSIDSSSQTMLGGLLVLSALIHAAASIFQSGAQRAFRVSLALACLVATSAIFAEAASPTGLVFAIACLMVPTVVVAFPMPWNPPQIVSAVLLFLGLLGARRSLERMIALASDPSTGIPLILPVLFAVAYALCAFSFFACVLSQGVNLREKQLSISRLCLWAVVGILLQYLVYLPFLSEGRTVGSAVGTIVWLLAVAGILGVVWKWRETLSVPESLAESSLVKLLNNDFKIGELLNRGAFTPLQEVSTNFQTNLSHLLLAIPGSLFQTLCDDVRLVDESRHRTPSDEDSSNRNELTVTLVLAIAVMIAAIWLAA
ncbi:hypothetical protein KOR42_16130 [Thalassoglobus neptunius]|uniref:Uncharacterized protein n=1 Tax=Thalassoglobus neptunius TaxID=1938619 RepID=A0A5C5X8P3_9PLAN|nr:hypothetical protein [Thalassoglobus neptunius]TWT58242.1 hypothetical protein KOR42_16130 [Thalassoglobus neptunius]